MTPESPMPDRLTPSEALAVVKLCERAVLSNHLVWHSCLNEPPFPECHKGYCGEWKQLWGDRLDKDGLISDVLAAALARPTPLPNPSLDRAREAAGELFGQLDPQKDPTLYVCAEDVVDFLSSLARPTELQEFEVDLASIREPSEKERQALKNVRESGFVQRLVSGEFDKPASPPPTQGWEEALRFLEAEAFQFEEDHEPPAWCGHCGHPYQDEPEFKHEPYCPVAKRLATLRSHLSGRETHAQSIDENTKPQK